MKHSRFVRVALPAILLVTATLACNFPGTSSGVDVNMAATQTMRVLETIVAETLQVGGIEETSQPVEPPPTEAPEPEAPTPTMTATITPTPTETQTPTPSVPMVSVSMNTNCRFGPGKVYDYLGALLVGETAEVAGRISANTYWYIHNPDRPGGFCWIWGRYATVTGDTSQLPVLTPPPTPTPAHTPTPAYNWTGNWAIYGDVVKDGTAMTITQTGNSIYATYILFNVTFVMNGTVSADGRTATGTRGYNGFLGGDFTWFILENQNQFSGHLKEGDDTFWFCGARNSAPKPSPCYGP